MIGTPPKQRNHIKRITIVVFLGENLNLKIYKIEKEKHYNEKKKTTSSFLASEYYYTCVIVLLFIFLRRFITWKLSPDRV